MIIFELGRWCVEFLLVSNGHGEDVIAARIGQALQKRGAEVLGLPMVGAGHSYTRAGIAIVSELTQVMPSGGFVRMDQQKLAEDVQKGLVGLTRRQMNFVWGWSRAKGSQNFRRVLAVGDIVPLLLAWLPTRIGGSAPFAFIATAKSEYYWRDRQGQLTEVKPPFGGSLFYPWERIMMQSRCCCGLFVRDQLTADHLRDRFRISAQYLGNPMMDGLDPIGLDFGICDDDWAVAVLPGSRPPEAYDNWIALLTCAQVIARALAPQTVHFLVALAPALDRNHFTQMLTQRGWLRPPDFPFLDDPARQASSSLVFKSNNAQIHLIENGFADVLHQSHIGLGMAGTATEQMVGLGKPVITIAGNGPQFTPLFAVEQVRLLGCSVKRVEKPAQITEILNTLLKDPDYFQATLRNGIERMGHPGASARIADYLMQS
ncbi:MAG: lipid-A-disaccharide synthase-related protein [Pseudanabaena sp. ELA607]